MANDDLAATRIDFYPFAFPDSRRTGDLAREPDGEILAPAANRDVRHDNLCPSARDIFNISQVGGKAEAGKFRRARSGPADFIRPTPSGRSPPPALPAPRPAAPPARGTGCTTRNPARLARRSAMEAGSPPCSPQIPSFRWFFVARPFSAAMRTISPTPSMSIETNGSFGRIPASTYFGRNLPASSRDRPNTVCVRSLVPKLKKSAILGDLVRQQRGARQFDHGADAVLDLLGRSRRTLPPPPCPPERG